MEHQFISDGYLVHHEPRKGEYTYYSGTWDLERVWAAHPPGAVIPTRTVTHSSEGGADQLVDFLGRVFVLRPNARGYYLHALVVGV